MNNNDIRFDRDDKNTYHATSNLNTAIENPQININSVVGVNIKNVDSTNPMNDVYSSNLGNDNAFHSFQNDQSFDIPNSNNNFQGLQNGLEENLVVNNNQVNSTQNQFETNQDSSHFVPTNNFNSETSSGVNYVATTGNDQVIYEPTMKEKKKRGVTFKVTRELKVMLFIVLILFVFILIVPYIYDFFKELQLVITTG